MIIIIIAEICHDSHDRRWCTFSSGCTFLQREREILSYFGQFGFLGLKCKHFLVYFYRPKKCVGVTKLTNIRSDDHLQGAIPDAGQGVHQTQQSLRGENNLATWSCLKKLQFTAP